MTLADVQSLIAARTRNVAAGISPSSIIHSGGMGIPQVINRSTMQPVGTIGTTSRTSRTSTLKPDVEWVSDTPSGVSPWQLTPEGQAKVMAGMLKALPTAASLMPQPKIEEKPNFLLYAVLGIGAALLLSKLK